jgi:hypothetical protein
MHVVIAPGRLKDGVTEEEMLAASDRFQREFVVHHPGVVRRVLVAGEDGRYADIVFFADETAIAEVMAAEQDSEVCHQFMAMWDDAEVAMWRVLQLHE